jgi:multiple sugar transport system permease protein
MKRQLMGYAFIAPWLVGFLVFTAFPFLASIYLSFTRYNVVTAPVWIGAAFWSTRPLASRPPLPSAHGIRVPDR